MLNGSAVEWRHGYDAFGDVVIVLDPCCCWALAERIESPKNIVKKTVEKVFIDITAN